MSNNKIEELLPLVAELANKYTLKESSSITYETAYKLMCAVVYCINEYESCKDNSLIRTSEICNKEKYKLGLEFVINKIKETQEMYNELIVQFDSYGNINYYDTVVKGISSFFLYYDYKFEPQNNIITCDYPTIISIFNTDMCGIDLIHLYVKYIFIEQSFLFKIPRESIVSILNKYDCKYTIQYYNISSVILRHILACKLINKKRIDEDTEKDYNILFSLISQIREEELMIELNTIFSKMINKYYDGDENMYNYFVVDIKEFAVQMKSVSDEKYLRNVVIL